MVFLANLQGRNAHQGKRGLVGFSMLGGSLCSSPALPSAEWRVTKFLGV